MDIIEGALMNITKKTVPLCKRIIPTILSKNGNLVKGEAFKADRVCGDALAAARVHAMRGVDELLIFDLDCSEPNFEMIRKLTEDTFTPVTVGGGISLLWDVERLFTAGADKVCIGSERSMIYVIAGKYGSQAVAATLDVRDNTDYKDVIKQAKWMADEGVGEIILQGVEEDGTLAGYDLDLIARVAEKVNIPIVASGGCSGYEDMYDAIDAGASAVAVGALFQFTACTPRGAAEYLSDRGVEVRL